MTINYLNPIHHWKLNDNTISDTTQLIRDTGLNNPGNASGYNVVMSQTGLIGQCVQFTGSAYIETGSITTVISNTAISLALWAKPTAHTAGTLFGLGNMDLGVNSVGVLYVGVAGANTQTGVTSLTSASWNHVAWKQDASSAKFYINGSLDKVLSISAFATPGIMSIGKLASSAAQYFNGYIEDVRIYDKALTDWEIKQIYNEGAGTYRESIISEEFNDSSLIHHWKLNDATTTIQDYGSNQIYATALNCVLSQTGKIDRGIGFVSAAQSVITLPVVNIPASSTVGVTFGGWVNFSSTAAKTAWFLSAFTTGGYYAEVIAGPAGPSDLYIYQGALGISGYTYVQSITVSNWYHVISSKGLNGLSNYINGELVYHTSLVIATSNIRHAFLGARSGTSLYLDGTIEDFRIYNRELSPREVKQIYNYGAGTYNQSFIQSPVHHWRLNDSISQIHDYGLNPVTGTAVNCLLSQTGIIDKSIQFTGTAYVEIDSGDLPDKFTVAFWMNTTNTTAFQRIINKDASNQLFIANNATSGLRFSYDGAEINQSSNMSDGNWHHVCGVYDGSYIKLYADTSIISLTAHATATVYSGSALYFGRNNTGGEPYTGYLEDVRIYDRALEPIEILKIYNEGRGTYLSDVSDKKLPSYYDRAPIHQWRLNDATTSIMDYGLLPQTGTAVACQLSQTGVIDKSTRFTGTSSYINAGTSSPLGECSFSNWIKLTNLGSMTVYDCSSLSCAFTINHTESEGKVRIYTGAANHRTYDNTALVADTWYHMINTWDAATMALYINASQVTAILSTTGTLVSPTSGTFFIGANSGAANFFNGYIEDVRIYDYALSAGAIQNIYNEGIGTYGRNPEDAMAIDAGSIYRHSADTWNKINDIAPLHHWKLNEFSGTTVVNDSGTNPMPGSITSCVLSQTGIIDRCMLFTGTISEIYTNTIPTIAVGGNEFSVLAWFKTAENIGTRIVCGNYDNTADYPGFKMGMDSGSSVFFGYLGNDGESIQVRGSTNLTTSSWYHGCITYGSGFNEENMKLYLNASEERGYATSTVTATGTATQVKFQIGCVDGALNWYGNIEDVRIYDRVLSQPEIAAIYNGGRGTYDHSYRSGFPTVKDPIHHWKLQETTLTAAFQVSDSGSNAMTPAIATDCLYDTSTGMANIERCFGFTGTASYIALAPITFVNGYTISIWGKHPIQSTTYPALIGDRSGANDIEIYYGTANQIVHQIHTTVYYNQSFSLIGADWNLITAKYVPAESQMYTYINGVEAGVAIAPTALLNITVSMYIGQSRGLASSFFEGNIADVRIYDYALSAEEIKNLYNGGKGTLL